MSLVGRQIGRYRIVEELGQGGMSVVYKGVDTSLDREVAVKVLHPHLARRSESRMRLEREAKAVARLHHPNILEVFDYAVGDADDPYIVTEYIRGQTLRQFFTQHTVQPPEVATMVVHSLSAALAHAHQAGVLHRDLKPENVMIREDGALKLMDFGIAKILDRDERMTMTGALVGSPAHMAPEIIEGEEAGAPADVFSLGTMLYLFATGELPFTGPSTTATLKRILDGAYVDPRQRCPKVSDELAEIIATCLRREPSARYPDAGALHLALGELLREVGLERPAEELPAFFLDPDGFRHKLTPRLSEHLVGRAERLLTERKTAKALSVLNHALAHDPRHPRALELIDQAQARRRSDRRYRRLLRAATAAGGLLVVGLAGTRGFLLATAPPDLTLPTRFNPAEITLAGVAWPQRPSLPLPVPRPEATVTPIDAARPPVPSSVHRSSAPELIDVVVVVRPFGYLTVDDGPRSPDALARHALRLTQGHHRFTVSCDACEPAGRTVDALVTPGQEVPLAAPLRPALVSFAGFPPDARVRVGAVDRAAGETQGDPFRIVTPPRGSPRMQHLVEYEVTASGAVVEKGSRWVDPGSTTTIEPANPATHRVERTAAGAP